MFKKLSILFAAIALSSSFIACQKDRVARKATATTPEAAQAAANAKVSIIKESVVGQVFPEFQGEGVSALVKATILDNGKTYQYSVTPNPFNQMSVQTIVTDSHTLYVYSKCSDNNCASLAFITYVVSNSTNQIEVQLFDVFSMNQSTGAVASVTSSDAFALANLQSLDSLFVGL